VVKPESRSKMAVGGVAIELEEEELLRSFESHRRSMGDASDATSGCANFLLDDERWTSSLSGRADQRLLRWASRADLARVLREVDWSSGGSHVALTREKVKKHRAGDVDGPVSRQHERDHFGYYGYPYYGVTRRWAWLPTRGWSR